MFAGLTEIDVNVAKVLQPESQLAQDLHRKRSDSADREKHIVEGGTLMGILEFHRPRTLEEALAFLDRAPERSMVVAGGTDILLQLKQGDFQPHYLIALDNVEELAYVAEDKNHIRIGAGTTIKSIVDSDFILKHLSILREACASKRTFGYHIYILKPLRKSNRSYNNERSFTRSSFYCLTAWA